MTCVALCSIKGSPGVTTLATLLASTWPDRVVGQTVVVEADPSGGDLAGRFGLSGNVGWSSLRSSERRSLDGWSLDGHLQYLPGGLPVLAAGRGADVPDADDPLCTPLWALPGERWDRIESIVVDLGRLSPSGGGIQTWMARSDRTLVVTRGGTADLIHVRERAAWLMDATGGAVGLVTVGPAPSAHELLEFTGLELVGRMPLDGRAAAVAAGAGGMARRLTGSALLAASRRLAAELAEEMPHDTDSTNSPGSHSDQTRRSNRPRTTRKLRSGARLRRTGSPSQPRPDDRAVRPAIPVLAAHEAGAFQKKTASNVEGAP